MKDKIQKSTNKYLHNTSFNVFVSSDRVATSVATHLLGNNNKI